MGSATQLRTDRTAELRPPSGASKIVLVVGGSSGVGAATAAELSRRGHTVFATARDAARVSGEDIRPLALDVNDEPSIARAVETILNEAGRIDAVLYTAGFYLAGPVEETSSQLAADQIDAYLLGAHRVTRAVLPAMRAAGSGCIVYMSSTAVVAPIPFHALYSASKAGLDAYVEALSYELSPFGVSVLCVEGIGVRTGAADSTVVTSASGVYEGARERIISAFRNEQINGPEPIAFAKSIAGVIESPKPPVKLRVGATAKLLPVLRAMLPARLFRWGIDRRFNRN